MQKIQHVLFLKQKKTPTHTLELNNVEKNWLIHGHPVAHLQYEGITSVFCTPQSGRASTGRLTNHQLFAWLSSLLLDV